MATLFRYDAGRYDYLEVEVDKNGEIFDVFFTTKPQGSGMCLAMQLFGVTVLASVQATFIGQSAAGHESWCKIELV